LLQWFVEEGLRNSFIGSGLIGFDTDIRATNYGDLHE
jgi:hypothetical protein